MAFAPRETKAAAYKTLIRPKLEYAAPVWMPHHQKEIDRIVKVQRTAARWTCRRWRNQSHVEEMLDDLQWPTLQERRQQASLILFYKIYNNLAIIEKSRYLSVAGGGGGGAGELGPTPFSITVLMHTRMVSRALFFPRTITTWNGLTTEAVSAKTVDGFKAKI